MSLFCSFLFLLRTTDLVPCGHSIVACSLTRLLCSGLLANLPLFFFPSHIILSYSLILSYPITSCASCIHCNDCLIYRSFGIHAIIYMVLVSGLVVCSLFSVISCCAVLLFPLWCSVVSLSLCRCIPGEPCVDVPLCVLSIRRQIALAYQFVAVFAVAVHVVS